MSIPKRSARTRLLLLATALLLAGCGGADPSHLVQRAGSPERVDESQSVPAPLPAPVEDQPEYVPGPPAKIEVVSDWTLVQAQNSSTHFRVLRINGSCFVQEFQGDLILAPESCNR